MTDVLANTSYKLYVGGLSWETTTESLRDCFERFGEVESAEVVRERDSGRSRGFGFVTFTDRSAAEAAIRELNNTEFEGRTIRIDFAAPRGGGQGGRSDFRGSRGRSNAPYERRGGFRGRGRGGGFRGGDRSGYGRYGGDRYGGDRYSDRYGDRD